MQEGPARCSGSVFSVVACPHLYHSSPRGGRDISKCPSLSKEATWHSRETVHKGSLHLMLLTLPLQNPAPPPQHNGLPQGHHLMWSFPRTMPTPGSLQDTLTLKHWPPLLLAFLGSSLLRIRKTKAFSYCHRSLKVRLLTPDVWWLFPQTPGNSPGKISWVSSNSMSF